MDIRIMKKETAYYKTRNAGIRNNRTQNTGGTAENQNRMWNPGAVVEQRSPPENKLNTPEYQRNINLTPAKHP